MPKVAKELGALAVSRLDKPGDHCVGGVPGLFLQINGSAKSWILRVVIGGKRRKAGLGSFPGVTLAQAREKAREARNQISRGIDPIDEKNRLKRLQAKEKAQMITFSKAASDYIADKEHEWKNDKHRQQWENTLATYAFPVIGQTPVGEVDRADILAILKPIWLEKTETARRLRGRLEKILDWAEVHEYREGANPARWSGHLEVILPKPSKVMNRRHHPAVPYKDVPLVVKKIMRCDGLSRFALIFTILTAARTSEVLGATWPEIDLDLRMWIVPAERMKANRIHRVPLSSQALEWLKRLPTFVGTEYLFPSRTGKASLSNMSMVALMRRLALRAASGEVAVPHGFRSSFRDWAADCTNFTGDVAEMALAHAIEDETEAAYRRGDMLQKRFDLMQRWGDYCFSLVEPGDFPAV